MRFFWSWAVTLGLIAPAAAADFSSAAQEQADAVVIEARGTTIGRDSAAPLTPDETRVTQGQAGRVLIRLMVEQGSRYLAVPGADALQACAPGETVDAAARLSSEAFRIFPEARFKVSASAACGTQVDLLFRRSNPRAMVLRVWRVAALAKAKLDGEVGPQAWSSVGFSIAAGAEEASSNHGQVLVGDRNTTFAVGHELGRVVSESAGLIQAGFDVTHHEMFRCIDMASALEEGWASFFAAWVDNELDASDPLEEWEDRPTPVNRITIRSVPATLQVGPWDRRQAEAVCPGPDNELRVTSFLWNLVAEAPRVPFRSLWQALHGRRLRSAAQLAASLERLGVSREKLQAAWAAAFQTSYPD